MPTENPTQNELVAALPDALHAALGVRLTPRGGHAIEEPRRGGIAHDPTVAPARRGRGGVLATVAVVSLETSTWRLV